MCRSSARRLALALVLSAAAVPARSAGTVLELRGEGVQIYACDAGGSAPGGAPGGFTWQLKAPDASLRDAAGSEVGRHFAGPSWRARDGSTVVGQLLVSSPAPDAGAIPWLLLRARSHAGQGAFAAIGFIARTRTRGGLAPATGCDRAHLGAEARVPYRATYLLFPR